MSDKVKNRLMKYGITGVACGAIAVYYALSNNVAGLSGAELYRVLSDAFFLPGVLLVLSGLLMWLSKEGTLDGVGFVLSRAIHLLIPTAGLQRETYGEYVERKRGKRSGSFGFLIIVGAVSVAVSLIFTALYMNAHGPI